MDPLPPEGSRPDEPIVSINIPVYRQLTHARACVASILSQRFASFVITLYDDGASDEYRAFVESLGDPRVRYVRNPARLGAMRNMFACITHGRSRYTLAFHEDDVMGPGYLEAAVRLLEQQPALGFVCAEVHEISDRVPAAAGAVPRVDVMGSPADFVRAILEGVNPMFGSAVYRRAAVAGVLPDHDAYATLVDRPFLLAILERWSGAVIRDPLVGYRSHGSGDRDGRHLAMGVDHIVRLFQTYKAQLPQPLGDRDRQRFYAFSGYWLFALYDLTPPADRPRLASYLRRVWQEGLYHPGGRGRRGLRVLMRALTGARSWAVS